MELILFMGFGLFFLVILIFFRTKRRVIKETESQIMQKEIAEKQMIITTLDNQIIDRTWDNASNLTKTQKEVLDIYEQSHIRIPVDIIEDLTYSKMYDEKDILAFIENQRNYWKLENTKKPLKRRQ